MTSSLPPTASFTNWQAEDAGKITSEETQPVCPSWRNDAEPNLLPPEILTHPHFCFRNRHGWAESSSWAWDMSPPSPQIAFFLIKASFLSIDSCFSNYWLLSDEEPKLSLVTLLPIPTVDVPAWSITLPWDVSSHGAVNVSVSSLLFPQFLEHSVHGRWMNWSLCFFFPPESRVTMLSGAKLGPLEMTLMGLSSKTEKHGKKKRKRKEKKNTLSPAWQFRATDFTLWLKFSHLCIMELLWELHDLRDVIHSQIPTEINSPFLFIFSRKPWYNSSPPNLVYLLITHKTDMCIYETHIYIYYTYYMYHVYKSLTSVIVVQL